jgi:hypothetical protein
MIFDTKAMQQACALLSISSQEIHNSGEPTEHMGMARLLARELSLLTYEEAAELFENDGEIVVEITPRRRILRLAPGECQTPGNGLPTEEELMELEREHARLYAQELESAHTDSEGE